MDDSRIKDVSSLLRAFFDEEQVRKGGQFARFFSSWKSLVGERAAGHSRIADVERGNLVIEVDHPGWIQLLQLRQKEILDGARRRFPELELRGILFRLSREAGPGGAGSSSGEPNIGPFGPGGRPLESAEESPGLPDQGSGTPSEAGEEKKKTVTLADIEDPLLKARLEELKKAVDEGKKRQ